jgi:4-amino-4-deoxy-L-arabinose transferase-like glycosyltransferase
LVDAVAEGRAARRFDLRRARASLLSATGLQALALTAILAVAVVLRLVGIRYGLPFAILNPDEANIVPRAWRVGHGEGLDPHWYDYPSLQLYVLAPFEALFAHVSYGAARGVAVAIGAGGVLSAWWLGRRAYGTHAAVVAAATVAVATTHVAYSRTAVTDVPMATAVTCALALMLAGRLEWAGVAVGVAAAFKYPGAIAIVPLVVAAWGRWRSLARAVALGAGVFVVATPYVLVHAGAAWEATSRVNRLARAGWLGFEDDPATPFAYVERLWETVGPMLVVAALGLLIAIWRRRRVDLVLVSFAVAYWLTLMPQRAHFDRYVLPLVPVLAVLAARLRVLAPLALALLVVPLVWSIGDAKRLTRTDTRVAAAPRIVQALPAAARVAADPSTPALGRRVLDLQLPGPGRARDPNRDLARLRAAGIYYVLVTGAVTDRVLRARSDYPFESLFYDSLTRLRPVVDVEPGHGLTGPWVRLYRITPSAG